MYYLTQVRASFNDSASVSDKYGGEFYPGGAILYLGENDWGLISA